MSRKLQKLPDGNNSSDKKDVTLHAATQIKIRDIIANKVYEILCREPAKKQDGAQ